MPQYSYAFFDLDGTVIDSAPGVTGCVRYAMEQLGRPIPSERDLTCFIGPTLLYGFSNFCGLDPIDSQKAVDLYRVRYRAGGMFECRVYEGVEELLKELNARGIPCVLATCKPHEFATQIVAHFGLDKYFTLMVGPEISGLRNEKHEVIAYAMEQLGITDPSKILMVGDRDNDVLGAFKNNVACVGVRWGFGSEAELMDSGACGMLDSPAELLRYFEN